MSDTVAPATSQEELAQRLAEQRNRQAARRSPTPAVNGQGAPTAEQRSARTRSKSTSAQRWMRWLHVYASMIAFLIILFFGVTGLLLNHPSWIYGDEIVTTNLSGTLPAEVMTDDGRIEFLAVSEFLRNEVGVGGEVTNFDQVGNEGSINYTGPSYGASVRFDVSSLTYTVTVREEGFVNAMRDLHTASDTGAAWSLIVDVSAVFLVFVSITGLGIQLFMRKRRVRALSWLAGGAVVTVAIIWATMV